MGRPLTTEVTTNPDTELARERRGERQEHGHQIISRFSKTEAERRAG
jgi:hypothetical protein